MNKNEFGQLLKKARVSRNLTQKEAANLLYNSPQTISLWEKGDLDIKLDVLCNFINALKYSFLDFLNGKLVDSDNSFNYDNLKLLNNIKKYCKENNITKHDFQKSLDVSKPTFNKIINGTISISLWQYFEFCNHYNLELHKFFIEEKMKILKMK